MVSRGKQSAFIAGQCRRHVAAIAFRHPHELDSCFAYLQLPWLVGRDGTWRLAAVGTASNMGIIGLYQRAEDNGDGLRKVHHRRR